MIIPEQLLQEWKGLKSQGDNAEILKLMDVENTLAKSSQISRAFKTGKCPDAMFTALNSFYTAKKAALYTVKPPANDK